MVDSLEIVKVDLEEKSYDILIGEGVLGEIASQLDKIAEIGDKVFVVCDSGSVRYFQQLEQALGAKYKVWKITLEAGEHLKSFIQLKKICDFVLENKPDRKSTLIALGGGVVGDLTGFCASIIMRGINFVQVPTTLLAQVDSSVGGKTAINSKNGKNLIGAFYQPRLVLIDPLVLESLEMREFLCGYAEVFKYSLIGDYDFFEFLLTNQEKIKNRDLEVIKEMVKSSCMAKAAIVSKDETEQGNRALLNLGHTIAHSLEKEMGYRVELKHGEAVAIGIVLALKLSEFLGFFEDKNGIINRIEEHFSYLGINSDVNQIKDILKYSKDKFRDHIIANLYGDKKVESGKLVFILLRNKGDFLESFIEKGVVEKKLVEFFNLQLEEDSFDENLIIN